MFVNDSSISRDMMNSSNNKILFQKNVLNYLKQKLLYSTKNKTNNIPITSTTVSQQTAALTSSIECDCSHQITKLPDEYASIWKIGFFTLAFITSFISLVIIVAIIFRVICAKIKNKTKNNNLKGYKSSKKNQKSLLLDAANICTLSSSSTYGLSIKNHIASTSSNSIHLIKNDKSNDTNSTRCFIYGISNKMILDDLSNFYNLESGVQSTNNIPYFQANTIPTSFRPNFCSKEDVINSNTMNVPRSSINKQNNLIQRKNSKSCSNIMMYNEYDAIEANPANSESTGNLSASTAYSEVLLNEDLITTNKNSSSNDSSDVNFECCLNNNQLISSTSILTQELETKLKERRQMIENKSDKFQPKLIELNEENKCLSKNDFKNMCNTLPDNYSFSLSNLADVSSVISLTNNKKCACNSYAHKTLPINERKNYRKLSSISSTSNNNNNETETAVAIIATTTTAEILNKSKPEEIKSNNKINKNKAKIIIDSASKLPNKRESIRLLIENKAVSGNKQKEALEYHFNNLKQKQGLN